MAALRALRKSWFLWAFAAAATTVATFLISYASYEARELERAAARAALYRSTLVSALRQVQHLPQILASDPTIIGLAERSDVDALNRRFADIVAASDIDALYLMDTRGLTLAASNYATPQSFVGRNYVFRPYFRTALAGGRGEYYAVGATTKRPGYFIANALRDRKGVVLGVLAVKVDLHPLQAAWRAGGESVLVANGDGVIILSSDPAQIYRTLEPIAAARLGVIRAARQFLDQPLSRLAWRRTGANRWRMNGLDYLHAQVDIGRLGWRLHYLLDDSRAAQSAALTAIAGAIVFTALLLIAALWRSARLKRALSSSQQHRRALRRTNLALEQAQKELARATKMAALGQLAAAVTHELGQPISAMRNYLAAAEMTRDPGAQQAAIAHLTSIAQRMERITRQLKQFADPAPSRSDLVGLDEVVEGAKLLLAHDLAAGGVALRIESAPQRVHVQGDRTRLEQALVNLMRNAIAAMEESEDKHITLSIGVEGEWAILSVTDTGLGLGEKSLEELQEPFHTTQPSGKGMGLGLAITAAIMREHGGELSAYTTRGGGACFSLRIKQMCASTPGDAPIHEAAQ
ncbi:MAG: ATP-binding protein [Neomegalonema sp.]|nr:ATP-binding protein [Neomegalonema sp.]